MQHHQRLCQMRSTCNSGVVVNSNSKAFFVGRYSISDGVGPGGFRFIQDGFSRMNPGLEFLGVPRFESQTTGTQI